MRAGWISLVFLLGQVPIIALHTFGQSKIPNNMLRTSFVTTHLKSRIECGTWCSKNADKFSNCNAFHYEDGPYSSCECGEAYCHDEIKGNDSQEILAHVDSNCRRILPPGEPITISHLASESFISLAQ